jgi:Na+/melibiose symporter-like transporter
VLLFIYPLTDKRVEEIQKEIADRDAAAAAKA